MRSAPVLHPFRTFRYSRTLPSRLRVHFGGHAGRPALSRRGAGQTGSEGARFEPTVTCATTVFEDVQGGRCGGTLSGKSPAQRLRGGPAGSLGEPRTRQSMAIRSTATSGHSSVCLPSSSLGRGSSSAARWFCFTAWRTVSSLGARRTTPTPSSTSGSLREEPSISRRALTEMGLKLEGINTGGVGHRFVGRSLVVDVLAPDHLGGRTGLHPGDDMPAEQHFHEEGLASEERREWDSNPR
ncbi:MAG: hypothetical protein QOI99_2341 [Actinomycetota bacterium]|nr:hypothetical protein [Actinomycetota bacterium]